MIVMNTDIFFKVLQFLGFPINEQSEPVLLFVCVVLFLCIIIVTCLFNVLLYFLIIYVLEDLKILDKYTDKLPKFVNSIIKMYINTRKIFVIYEVLFALFVACGIIRLCFKVARIFM